MNSLLVLKHKVKELRFTAIVTVHQPSSVKAMCYVRFDVWPSVTYQEAFKGHPQLSGDVNNYSNYSISIMDRGYLSFI